MLDEQLPLDADELMNFADKIENLSPEDAVWVTALLNECMRLKMKDADLLTESLNNTCIPTNELNDQLTQVALDTAEWLKILWNVGYMGAGNFPTQPRTEFPLVELEDVLKSSLLARIRGGKKPLPFPPPTKNGLPWHDLLEDSQAEHAIEASLVKEDDGNVVGLIIEGCHYWDIIKEIEKNNEYIIQHKGKGPYYKICLGPTYASLKQEPPKWTCHIHFQERAGYNTYTLKWPKDDGSILDVTLRATNWTRADSEAEHWIALKYPDMYGQFKFEHII